MACKQTNKRFPILLCSATSLPISQLQSDKGGRIRATLCAAPICWLHLPATRKGKQACRLSYLTLCGCGRVDEDVEVASARDDAIGSRAHLQQQPSAVSTHMKCSNQLMLRRVYNCVNAGWRRKPHRQEWHPQDSAWCCILHCHPSRHAASRRPHQHALHRHLHVQRGRGNGGQASLEGDAVSQGSARGQACDKQRTSTAVDLAFACYSQRSKFGWVPQTWND